MGLDREESLRQAAQVFRPDLYRAALEGIALDLPGASSKIEGSIEVETPVASEYGRLTLPPDLFFDRRTFDPDATIRSKITHKN